MVTINHVVESVIKENCNPKVIKNDPTPNNMNSLFFESKLALIKFKSINIIPINVIVNSWPWNIIGDSKVLGSYKEFKFITDDIVNEHRIESIIQLPTFCFFIEWEKSDDPNSENIARNFKNNASLVINVLIINDSVLIRRGIILIDCKDRHSKNTVKKITSPDNVFLYNICKVSIEAKEIIVIAYIVIKEEFGGIIL